MVAAAALALLLWQARSWLALLPVPVLAAVVVGILSHNLWPRAVIRGLRLGGDQIICIARFELVRIVVQALQVGHAVVTGAGHLGGATGDDVGGHFERTPVVRHETERAAEVTNLLDSRVCQQLREERHVPAGS